MLQGQVLRVLRVRFFACVGRTYLQRGGHYLVADGEVLRGEVVVLQVEGDHVGEDAHHGVVAEGVDAADVEVAQEAGRHGVPPAPGGPHGRDDLQVHQRDGGGVLQVVPEETTIDKSAPAAGFVSGLCFQSHVLKARLGDILFALFYFNFYF